MKPGLVTTEKWLVAAWLAAMAHAIYLPLTWLHAVPMVCGTVAVCWYTWCRSRLKGEAVLVEEAACRLERKREAQ